MINIAVCDDEEEQVNLMYNYVKEVFFCYGVPFKITKCSNGADLLYIRDEFGDFDLVLLDINLTYDNGIDAAIELRKRSPYCHIIFVSGDKSYYKAAFQVQPYQFIDKPMKDAEMREVLHSVARLILRDDRFLAFDYKWKQYRILVDDILYFSCSRRKLYLCTRDGEEYEFYGKMKDIEAKMQELSVFFLRIHKSCMVNMKYVKTLHGNQIVMQDDRMFDISARKRTLALKRYLLFHSMMKKHCIYFKD